MRFVQPETKTLILKDGPNGEKNWIEVKKELTVGEEKTFRTAGLRRVSGMGGGETASVDVDWTAMAFARVNAYLQDWSAKDTKGKDLAVSPKSIAALDDESFTEIDEAIQAHIAEQLEEKKLKNGEPTSPTPQPSATS